MLAVSALQDTGWYDRNAAVPALTSCLRHSQHVCHHRCRPPARHAVPGADDDLVRGRPRPEPHRVLASGGGGGVLLQLCGPVGPSPVRWAGSNRGTAAPVRLLTRTVTPQRTTPIASRIPAIRYCSAGRPAHGVARYAQASAPTTGSTVGVRKWSASTRSRRSTRTATLTTVKTMSSSRAVVPPSAGTAPTKVISQIGRASCRERV